MGFANRSFVRSGLCLCLLVLGGVAHAAQPTPATPLGNPGKWVTIYDYPRDALRDRRQGIVYFELSIDTEGRVVGCRILQASGVDQLDAATCALITERARFKPATNARGRATSGTYTNRVRWLLPDYPPRLAAPIKVDPFVRFDGNGNLVVGK